MKWWHWLLIAVGVVVGILVITFAAGVYEAGKEWEEQVRERELVVLEHSLVDYYGSPKVVGKAKNTEDVALGWVEAEVKWYGAGGVVLGTSSDLFVDSLEPGEVWEFEVWGGGLYTADVVSYDLEVTGTVL